VIEVDAATYSKVEQVRDLTEGLKYGPARDRYKVVVIDEIHRLSRQAFDALLKIVEEPPPRLVFIFATTEIDAVPATVLSRCQEFHFRRVPSEVVTKLLAAIAAEEGIVASDAALRLIARAGEGSVRDAVALLDQLATFGSGTVPDDEAVRLLGGLDTALFERLLGAIAEGDRGAIGELVARVEDEGWDPRHVYAQFLAYCRDALHLALDGRAERVDLPREEAQRLAERAGQVGFENLLRLLQQLLASEETVRRSDASSLAVEIAWLRAAELPRLTRVEELLSGRAPAAMKVEPVAPRPGPATPALAPATGAAAEAGDVIAGILDWLADRKPALASHLRASEARRFAGGTFEVVVAPDDDLLWSRLDKPANRELLGQAVTEVCGPDAGWTRTRSSGRPPVPAGNPPSERVEPPAEDPTFQAVLDIFKDTVERVERNEES
jgi:DNA polymerase-3 subunit gamma/tau